MNAFELFLGDGRPANIWACGKCRIVKRTQAEADKCCAPWSCKDCGCEVKQYRTKCEACESKERSLVWQKRFDAAELLESYEGWIWTPAHDGYQDGYFPDMEEFLDHAECRDEEGAKLPEFVFACKSKKLKLDISRSLEDIGEDGWEEMLEHTNGDEELFKAVERWNELNADLLTVWESDYKRKVAVPKNR